MPYLVLTESQILLRGAPTTGRTHHPDNFQEGLNALEKEGYLVVQHLPGLRFVSEKGTGTMLPGVIFHKPEKDS